MNAYEKEGAERFLQRTSQFEPAVIELMRIFPNVAGYLLWREGVLAYRPHGDPLDNALLLMEFAKAGRLRPYFHAVAGLIFIVDEKWPRVPGVVTA